MSQFLQREGNCVSVVKVWVDSPSHRDLPDQAWRPGHGECWMVARDVNVSALVWALMRCWIFHCCSCATRDIFGAVHGGGDDGLSGAMTSAETFLLFQGAQQSCRQTFWEADGTAWSETLHRVEHRHVSVSSAVKEGEYCTHMGNLRRISCKLL